MALPGSNGSHRVEPSPDWAAQTSGTIVRLVGQVRDRTTVPLLTLGRALVFGLLAGIVGVAALVLFLVMLVRVLDLLPGGVWVAYLILGSLFTIVGGVLMRLRRRSLEAA